MFFGIIQSNIIISIEDCAAVKQVGFLSEIDPPSANQYHIREAATVGAVIGRHATRDTEDDLIQGTEFNFCDIIN